MPPHPEPPRFHPAHAPISLRIGDFRLRRTGIARYDLLRDPYYAAVTAPWWAFGLSALALLLSVNLLFAVLFLLRPAAVQNLPAGSLADSFFFSMETMSTVGYGAMAPSSPYGHAVATAEMVVGLGLVASLTGILFVRLSRPRARILFADRPAVNGGGDPVLSIRIANGRRVPLLDATASLAAVLLLPGADGSPTWQLHHLPLEEDRNSLFPLTWTLRHPLDASSPLGALGPAGFAAARVRLVLMVAAHDPAINADVRQMREYAAGSVAFDSRYALAISSDADGQILADLARLGDLDPDPAPDLDPAPAALRTAAIPPPGSSA